MEKADKPKSDSAHLDDLRRRLEAINSPFSNFNESLGEVRSLHGLGFAKSVTAAMKALDEPLAASVRQLGESTALGSFSSQVVTLKLPEAHLATLKSREILAPSFLIDQNRELKQRAREQIELQRRSVAASEEVLAAALRGEERAKQQAEESRIEALKSRNLATKASVVALGGMLLALMGSYTTIAGFFARLFANLPG
ncbi:MAG: hypothetical protein V4614_18690 [Pseudomonadota bacterium]